MSVQTARKRVPRRQEQMHLVRQAAAAAEAETHPPEPVEQAEPTDPNRLRAQKILDRLSKYGVPVPMQEIRAAAVERALVLVLLDNIAGLVDKGLFTEEQMATKIYALEAATFSGILQDVEQQRLAQAEQAKQPVATRGRGELWAPGRH